MSERVYLIPATPELRVRKPIGGHLAPAGEHVELDSYWRRRLADGDVLQTEPATDPATEQKAAKAAK